MSTIQLKGKGEGKGKAAAGGADPDASTAEGSPTKSSTAGSRCCVQTTDGDSFEADAVVLAVGITAAKVLCGSFYRIITQSMVYLLMMQFFLQAPHLSVGRYLARHLAGMTLPVALSKNGCYPVEVLAVCSPP